jgi:phosphoribosylformylglycinamidine synthase
LKACVIVFPGSNCDHDAQHALSEVAGFKADFVWHAETDLDGYDLIMIPGGFSYGDHLRSGAVARFAAAMGPVQEAARRGTPILGVCNGFQILLEAGLLPGAMLRNAGLEFRHDWVGLRIERTDTMFTSACEPDQILRMPIAHGDGNYYADPATIARLEGGGQVLFRYCDEAGETTQEANPNGSINNIAGITNERGNVLGMMPHPERASEMILGGDDGAHIWRSLVAHLEAVPVG